MPDITITDSVHASAEIELNDGAPLGLAKLSRVNFSSLPFVGDITKRVDQCSFEQVAFGPTLIAPSLLLSDDVSFRVQGAQTGTLSLHNASSKTLFEDDGFSPALPIQPDECWIGLELELALTAKIGAVFSGFGVAATGASQVGAGTYVLLKSGSTGLPLLRDALKLAFESYSANQKAAAIRAQQLGVAHTLDTGGSIRLSGSYSLPIAVNPLASARLPLNYQISLDPDVTVRVGGEATLSGDFILRSFKTSETELTLGVYKKKKTNLAVTFEAGVGIGANIGETDIVGAFLSAVFPAVDPTAAGFSEEQSEELKGALKDCIDSSLSVAVNSSCSASNTDESAIVYSINLAGGDQAQTDKAIDSALHGDWTLLAALPNAKSLRNIFREMHETKHKVAVNLLGFYNAGAVTDYIKSCTIIHDISGQVALVDKVSARHITVAGMPYRADSEKLRSALAEGFLATATYGAGAADHWKLKDFSVQQNYVKYKAKMSGHDLHTQLLLARALHLLPDEIWNSTPAGDSVFDHVKIWVNARYDAVSVLRLFYADVELRTPYTRPQLERAGRDAKTALLDSPGPRLSALRNDATWNAMTNNGNVSKFHSLPELSGVSELDCRVIGADWADIVWWAKAMLAVTPKLTQVLEASKKSEEPNHKALEDALAKAAPQASSAFGDGWGLLTTFLLSGAAPELDIEIGWNGKFQHYPPAPKVSSARA